MSLNDVKSIAEAMHARFQNKTFRFKLEASHAKLTDYDYLDLLNKYSDRIEIITGVFSR